MAWHFIFAVLNGLDLVSYNGSGVPANGLISRQRVFDILVPGANCGMDWTQNIRSSCNGKFCLRSPNNGN